MRNLLLGLVCCLPFAGAAGEAYAQVLSANLFGVDFTARGEVSVQGAAFRDPQSGLSDEGGEWDASLILNAERVTPGGLVYGFRAEVDSGNRVAEDLRRDETYVYVAGEFGRIELGEQDGPADTVSYHAPVLGLGQIRGDFVRYAGSPALLSPLDTSDAPKLVYLSSPQRGFRFGVSYAPEYKSNENSPNPRARTIQQDAFEAAAAFQTTLGDWAGGISIAYVGAEADPITERADIESLSVGFQFSRNELSIGGAFVSRGDSNSLTPGLGEEEVNLGVAWRANTWGVGVSASQSSSLVFDNTLFGLGGYFELAEYLVLRADVVAIEESRLGGPSSSGHVLIAETAFVF